MLPIDNASTLTTIKGLKIVHLNCQSRGGGLACYICDDLASDCLMLPEMSITTQHIELQVLKIAGKSHKLRYIFNIYRPPDGDVVIFFRDLENLFLTHDLNDRDVCLLGDLNINYHKRLDKRKS